MALSDPTGFLATPLTTIVHSTTPQDCQRILELAHQHQVNQLVVGLPLSLKGTLGFQARRIQAFVRALEKASDLPVALWDERLTTVEAERLLRQAGSAARKDRGQRDAAAAALILQAYLDAHGQSTP